MAVEPGQTLLHYRVVERIGEGGMGVVWRATDTSLHRDVAIKVLPDALSRDAERIARFEREARVLASLDHPNIASIHGLHSDGDLRFIAMELAQGESLAARLARGAVAVPEALEIGVQLAEAIETAHEQGVIHRDLKPANIMLGSTGIKVLDFGLAKALEGDAAAESNQDLSKSPTVTARLTSAHVILGTVAYMSPEQARGQAVDRRTDIWSFGVVLFETLTGQRMFSGETVSDTLASVLKVDPDWSKLPKDTPLRLRILLQRCLDRDRRRRLRDMGEARLVLEGLINEAPDAHLRAAIDHGLVRPTTADAGVGARRPTWTLVAAVAALAVTLTLAASWILSPPASREPRLRKLALGVGSANGVRLPNVSPDGRKVAYLANDELYVRRLDSTEPRSFDLDTPVASIFWSPDSREIACIVGRKIIRIDTVTGSVQTVIESREPFEGGSWGHWRDDDVIVFSRADSSGLMTASARGGDPTVYTATDTSESDFHHPHVLPGNRGVVVVPHRNTSPAFSQIHLLGGSRRKVLYDGLDQILSHPCFSPTGHLIYQRSPTNPGVWALPFSLAGTEIQGEPFVVAPDGTFPTVSEDGTLVYLLRAKSRFAQLTLNDARGNQVADLGRFTFQGTAFPFPAVSRDGRRVMAVEEEDDERDLWVIDIARETRSRITFNPTRESTPDWSPDGREVVWHQECGSLDCLRVIIGSSDGSGSLDTLGLGAIPRFTPDGKSIVYTEIVSVGDWDVFSMSRREGERSKRPIVEGPGRQMTGRISPDGRLLAYCSDRSGDWEVHLTRFPSGQGRWQVSIGRGMNPSWDHSGKRLYYSSGDEIVSVDVVYDEVPILGRPQTLFARPPLQQPVVNSFDASFDVLPNGQFVFFRPAPTTETEGRSDVMVVENWFEEFRNNPE